MRDCEGTACGMGGIQGRGCLDPGKTPGKGEGRPGGVQGRGCLGPGKTPGKGEGRLGGIQGRGCLGPSKTPVKGKTVTSSCVKESGATEDAELRRASSILKNSLPHLHVFPSSHQEN